VPQKQDGGPTAGRAALRDAGIGDDESEPAALVSIAGRTPELDLAILARLGAKPSDAAASAVADIARAAEGHGWKAVAKEARRVLYRFGQRGITIPVVVVAPEPGAVARAATTLEGYVSPIDGRGDRLVWLVRPQRDGGLVVVTAILNEPAGLRDVAVAELTRKALRRMEADMRERHRLRMVAADGGYCDALLWEGFTRARAAGTTGIGEYPTYRTRLVAHEPASPDPPLIARIVDLDSPATANAAADGARLLEQPEFMTWGPERAALAPYASEIASVRESTLVLSRPLQEERVAAIVARTVRELFGGDAAHAHRRRLEEMAYYLHATGRATEALVAAASARALATSGAGGEGIAFFEALARRAFAALLAEEGERAKVEAESSLLVRPGAPAGPIAAPRPQR
jgi:hypothetical protein